MRYHNFQELKKNEELKPFFPYKILNTQVLVYYYVIQRKLFKILERITHFISIFLSSRLLRLS